MELKMTKYVEIIHDIETGKEISREFTPEEIAELDLLTSKIDSDVTEL